MRPHVTRPALCLALALVLWGGRVAGRSASSDSREGSPPACAARGDIPLDGLELSAEEEALLDDICWPPGATASELGAAAPPPRGVPPGINCTVTQWCDGDICTDICGRGTVSLEPWLENSVMQQTRLVQSLPLCFATLLGTHNSAISLADGYGNLDAHFSQFLNYIKWAVSDPSKLTLRTNDQLLSLTDQLNLGVRALELDTHWVGGDLRIAHCGGLHLDLLNKLVTALNFVAKLLHKRIRWDTETLGCSPSLSSIPTMEQRTLEDALREIAAWLDAPGREPDFLLLYFDDQADLQSWGVVGHLQETILRVFPPEVIFSVADKAAHPEAWPKVADLVVAGKRVMFVSNTDYGAAMQPYVFSRGQAVCGWTEPGLATVEGVPRCVVDTAGQVEPSPLFGGTLVRVETCELEYGPLNCDFVWHGTNQPVLDEETLPALVGCGLNIPAPDLMTPARAASAIWTWAPGHPYEPFERQGPPPCAPPTRPAPGCRCTAPTGAWMAGPPGASRASPAGWPPPTWRSLSPWVWRGLWRRSQWPWCCAAAAEAASCTLVAAPCLCLASDRVASGICTTAL